MISVKLSERKKLCNSKSGRNTGKCRSPSMSPESRIAQLECEVKLLKTQLSKVLIPKEDRGNDKLLFEKLNLIEEEFKLKEKEWVRNSDSALLRIKECQNEMDKMDTKSIDILRIFRTIQKDIEEFEKSEGVTLKLSKEMRTANHHIDSLLDI